MKISGAIDFDAPALNYARKDFPLLEADASVQKALETIRREGIGERVIYFYAVDERKRLVGVVPTRRVLSARPGLSIVRDHGAARNRFARESDCVGSVRIFCALQV